MSPHDTTSDILEAVADTEYKKRRLECLYIGSWLEERLENVEKGARLIAEQNRAPGIFTRQRRHYPNVDYTQQLVDGTVKNFEEAVAKASPQCGIPSLAPTHSNFYILETELQKAWRSFRDSPPSNSKSLLFDEFRKQWRIARNEGLPEE